MINVQLRTEEWEEFRFTLNKDDIAVKMFPNRVTAKALEDTKYREVTPFLLAPIFVYKTRFYFYFILFSYTRFSDRDPATE